MTDARSNILAKLRAAPRAAAPATDYGVFAAKTWTPAERFERLRRLMESVNTEFVLATADDLGDRLAAVLADNGVRRLAFGPDTAISDVVELACGNHVEKQPFDESIEICRDRLFDVDAGITTTRGGIADTGSLVLWSGPAEPRSLSLVPPLHIAVLDAARIHDTLWHVLRDENWADTMPTNVVLVSGPSKTADIEQTLTYGVHGPKKLIVIVVQDTKFSGG